jgi:Protein of unknown function (DUF2917)
MPELCYTLNLEDNKMLTLSCSQSTMISCQQGTLWITEENSQQDIVLSPGQHYTIQTTGKVVLSGLHAAELSIKPVGSHLSLASNQQKTFTKRLQQLFSAIEQTNLLNRNA